MNSLVEFLVEEDDAESINVRNRRLRDASNIFDMTESEFKTNFRMGKDCFRQILTEIAPHMKTRFLTTAISPELRLGVCLRFLACGSYQKSIANACFAPMCQAQFSRMLSECLDVFEQHFCANWIKLRTSAEEETATKEHFYTKCNIPGVVGCVDGTHIKLCSPAQNLKHLYYNRKGFYSINAMMICDQNMIIRFVDATHPGANHDAYVWRVSAANAFFNTAFDAGRRNAWILGDSGYQLQPYVMTPYRNPTQQHQIMFNEKHCKARNVIERCFGVLKNRFRCLIGERGLHYPPEKVTQIVNMCCALHNACIFYKNDWTHAVSEHEADSNYEPADPATPSNFAAGVRDRLAWSLV